MAAADPLRNDIAEYIADIQALALELSAPTPPSTIHVLARLRRGWRLAGSAGGRHSAAVLRTLKPITALYAEKCFMQGPAAVEAACAALIDDLYFNESVVFSEVSRAFIDGCYGGGCRATSGCHPYALSLLDSLLAPLVDSLGTARRPTVDAAIEVIRHLISRFGSHLRFHSKFHSLRFLCNGDFAEYLLTGNILGQGSYAVVTLGYLVSGRATNAMDGDAAAEDTTRLLPLAIKKVDYQRLVATQPELKAKLRSEIEIMRGLRHRNVVRLFDVLREGGQLYLMVELCTGGSLASLMAKRGGKLSEDEARNILRQLARGLRCLHSKGIIHRDIKPDNIMLHNDEVKLIDFTFARYVAPGSLAETLVGSPLYMAPEIMLHKKYNEKCDLWSVGVLLYEMVTGHPPYVGQNVWELLENIRMNKITSPLNSLELSVLSPQCRDLLHNLLQSDPYRRITWNEFFYHPFVACAVDEHKPSPSVPVVAAPTPAPMPAPLPVPVATPPAANPTVPVGPTEPKPSSSAENERIRALEEELRQSLESLRSSQKENENLRDQLAACEERCRCLEAMCVSLKRYSDQVDSEKARLSAELTRKSSTNNTEQLLTELLAITSANQKEMDAMRQYIQYLEEKLQRAGVVPAPED